MKPKKTKNTLKKDTFLAGDIVYPVRQFEDVLIAQLSGKPLPTPRLQ